MKNVGIDLAKKTSLKLFYSNRRNNSEMPAYLKHVGNYNRK